MIRWRELVIIAGLFGALILFTIYGPGQAEPDEGGSRGSAHWSGDEGALALQRWLASVGYAPRNLEYTRWSIPDDAQALLIIAPTEEPILQSEAEEIMRWVREGGTLIAVDERPRRLLAPNGLWDLLGVTATISDTAEGPVATHAEVVQPLLLSPATRSVPVNTAGSLVLDEPGYVTLLQTRYGPTLIGRQEGRGYLYLAVSAHPFTNQGLREPGSAALVLNLLSRVPRGAAVLFDEYHHGFARGAAAAPSLRRVALSQWWGWAGLYAVGVVGLYLVATGRRFGRPVPLQQDVARRSSAEYVQSMAQLLRRGRQRQPIAAHYRDALKRRLARPHGFIPPVDDAAFVRELARVSDASDEQVRPIGELLAHLSRPDVSDADLVRLVRVADTLVDSRGRLR